jgi:hypothetical protein
MAKEEMISMKSFLCKLGIVLVVVVTVFAYADVWGENWKSFGSTPSGSFYYDFDSITLVSKNLIKVWTQLVFSPAGISQMVEAFGPKYNNLQNQVGQFDIDCAESKVRITFFNYSRDGEMLASGQYKKGEWVLVPSGTVVSTLIQELCGLLTEGQFKEF